MEWMIRQRESQQKKQPFLSVCMYLYIYNKNNKWWVRSKLNRSRKTISKSNQKIVNWKGWSTYKIIACLLVIKIYLCVCFSFNGVCIRRGLNCTCCTLLWKFRQSCFVWFRLATSLVTWFLVYFRSLYCNNHVSLFYFFGGWNQLLFVIISADQKRSKNRSVNE